GERAANPEQRHSSARPRFGPAIAAPATAKAGDKIAAMADSEAELQAPLLLIAMPQILDPFFHRSVVLLVHHDGEGSLGFIINRPTAISVSEILQGMEIDWRGEHALVAHFGGPVQPQLGTVLFSPQGGNGDEAAGAA